MKNDITPEQFEKEATKITGILDRTRRVELRRAEILALAAGAAEVRELSRLTAKLGEKSPVVQARAAAVDERARTVVQLRESMRSMDVVDRLTKDSTIAVGKVVSEKGRPAVETRVAVTTDTGKPVGHAAVDGSGLFVLEMPRVEFERLVAGSKELILSVQDGNGNVLRQARTPLDPNSRAAVVMNFDLGRKAELRPGPAGPVTPSRPVEPAPGRTLADIAGLGTARLTRLREANITTLEAFVRMNPDELGRLLAVNRAQAEDFIVQAKKLLG